ncbi:MAG TPA: hypothetical protein VM370_06335 [Candidatus Thermoplasmatota archaeon]|nr:hypothetical protein [Candidatus Thermoplasmatota archaeon]
MGRHECAQRAASRILGVPAQRLARTHPPDTPLRLLGTTPRQLARMLTAHGRPSVARTRAAWSELAPGALVCVDLRPLLGGLPRLHWMLVEAVDAARVVVDGRAVPRAVFERAWACRCSPFAMHRRALVGRR